jgi:hypothetical protein
MLRKLLNKQKLKEVWEKDFKQNYFAPLIVAIIVIFIFTSYYDDHREEGECERQISYYSDQANDFFNTHQFEQ